MRFILYQRKINDRNSKITKAALSFEAKNNLYPNFINYLNTLNINADNFTMMTKDKIKLELQNYYNNYWWDNAWILHGYE